MINIKGIPKADLLQALYNGSFQPGMGVLDGRGAYDMPLELATGIVKIQTRFDYLFGRVMKVDITGDELNPSHYDLIVGHGAVQVVVDILRVRFSEGE